MIVDELLINQHLSVINHVYESSFFAISEMLFPSDFPAKFFEANPITFPKSLIDSALVSEIICFISASNSYEDNWAGKNY